MALLVACGNAQKETAEQGPVTLRLCAAGEGAPLRVARELAAAYQKESGIRVEIVPGPTDSTKCLTEYFQYFGARSSAIDAYQIDVIWPGMLAPYLLDLRPYMKDELGDFFPSAIESGSVGESLVAVPWHADAGVLYYRKDLLKEYGFEGPPKTWDEMETMAAKIQEGERRKGIVMFWGYAFQGAEQETLTCNALEWQASQGGGHIMEPNGRITVNNPKAIAAFDRAASWIGKISPPEALNEAESESLKRFKSGEAAFVRHWPYAWSEFSGEGSMVKGLFDATGLPAGESGSASTLGGWQLAVSAYSKHPQETIQLVKWMTSRRGQLDRAVGGSLLPTRPSLYDRPELREAMPIAEKVLPALKEATPRPATAAGDYYTVISATYYRHVHQVLAGKETGAQAAAAMEDEMLTTIKGR